MATRLAELVKDVYCEDIDFDEFKELVQNYSVMQIAMAASEWVDRWEDFRVYAHEAIDMAKWTGSFFDFPNGDGEMYYYRYPEFTVYDKTLFQSNDETVIKSTDNWFEIAPHSRQHYLHQRFPDQY